MNTDTTTTTEPKFVKEEEVKQLPKEEAQLSPFVGLVQVGQLFPLNGVWCRVSKFDGPHIILTAVEYTTKIKRYINAQNRTKARRKKE